MKAKLQKRLLPGVVITLLTVSTVFSGATAKAKGDAVISLSAGSAQGTVSVADSMEFVEMRLKGGVSNVVDNSYLNTESSTKQN